MTVEPKKLLVLGSPRSGTRYVKKVLQSAGMNLGHENVGEDGTVSGFFAVDDYWYPGRHAAKQRLSGYAFEHVWHVVRKPMHTISSMAYRMGQPFWHWQEKHTCVGECEPLVRAARFYVRWHRLIDNQRPHLRFKVEEMDLHWFDMRRKLGLQGDMPEVDHEIGRQPGKPERSIKDLEDLNRDAYAQVLDLTNKYGYTP